ncbi:MAG: LysM peptidoglycan-binding domain-containing protein [Chloroflexota bacterium]
MAQRGSGFDAGPDACPFVALELDRDRRSERPDYRHRCYAEQVPAPRTIAHQERFCLSPNFTGCPIFQDWAVRAAARPVPLPGGHESRRPSPDPRAVAPVPVDAAWPDSMDPALPAAAAGGLATESPESQQLSAFDSAPSHDRDVVEPARVEPIPVPPVTAPMAVPGAFESPTIEPWPSDTPATDFSADHELSADPDFDQPDDGASVPAFLAGRSSRPRRSPKVEDRITREDVVPSWEITDRYGAQQGGESRTSGLFGRLLTIVAIVIILALGVAAVVLIPGLLGGSGTRPSFATVPPRSAGASAIAVLPTQSPVVTPAPESVEPTPEATPAPSPRYHKIRSGDTLAKISRRYKVPVEDILAANPQIADRNHIEVGQFIVIPPRATPSP